MATSLTYAFNQQRFLALISRPGCTMVNFWLVNLIKHPHTEAYMYIYAQAHDADDNPLLGQDINVAGIRGEEACPVPPGWQCDLVPPTISKSQLEIAPRFSVEVAKLKTLVEQNQFVMKGRVSVNPDKHELINQVKVNLEGKLTDEGLEPVLALTSLKDDGTLIGSVEIEAYKKTPEPALIKQS